MAPAVSEYCKANVCVLPVPEDGETETVDGVPDLAGTVQAPRGCHPLLLPPASPAHMYSVKLLPAYPAANVTGRFSVMLLPLGDTVVLPALMVHWLLWIVPATPAVAELHPLAASFIRYNVFVARAYCTTHELTWVPVAMNHT